MKVTSLKILWTVISVAAFSGLVKSELIIEKAGLESEIAKSVSSDFGKLVRSHGQFQPVQSVSANSNEDFAVGLPDGEIAVWNSAIQTIKRTLTGHKAFVSSVKYFPNGNLVSGGHDSYARVWIANDSYSLKCRSYYGSGTQKFNQVLPTPNSDFYVIARSTEVSVMHAQNCYIYRYLRSHTGEVLSLARLANDDLVSGSADKTIKIWNWRNSTLIRTITVHLDSVTALVQLPSGELASGSADKTIKIWNWRDGILKRTITGHLDSVTALVQLPSGELASGSADKTIKIWNPNDGTLIHTLSGAHTGPISALVVLPNGLLASSSSLDNSIRIWDTFRGVNTHTIGGHTDGINDLSLLSSGELISASRDWKVSIWITK